MQALRGRLTSLSTDRKQDTSPARRPQGLLPLRHRDPQQRPPLRPLKGQHHGAGRAADGHGREMICYRRHGVSLYSFFFLATGNLPDGCKLGDCLGAFSRAILDSDYIPRSAGLVRGTISNHSKEICLSAGDGGSSTSHPIQPIHAN